jgi:two-component system chemotaxis response regulator CheY
MRAMVVDDATTVRLFHRAALEAAGFVVEEAANGVEALEVARRAPLDVNMPKMDGYAFLRAMRGDPALEAVAAVMVSTESREQDAQRAYSAGANLYLVKPVAPETLARFGRLLAGAPLS